MRLQVPRAACLEAAVEMLLESKHDFALLYVGKRQPDPVPAALAAQVAELTAAGKLLEDERRQGRQLQAALDKLRAEHKGFDARFDAAQAAVRRLGLGVGSGLGFGFGFGFGLGLGFGFGLGLGLGLG